MNREMGICAKIEVNVLPAGNIKSSVFLDSWDAIHNGFLIKHKTIPRKIHAILLDRLQAEHAEKNAHLARIEDLSFQDNTRVHKTVSESVKKSNLH